MLDCVVLLLCVDIDSNLPRTNFLEIFEARTANFNFHLLIANRGVSITHQAAPIEENWLEILLE